MHVHILYLCVYIYIIYIYISYRVLFGTKKISFFRGGSVQQDHGSRCAGLTWGVYGRYNELLWMVAKSCITKRMVETQTK